LRFSELKKMAVFSKDMKRIGKVADVELDLEASRIKALMVKVNGEEAKRIWKGILSLRSPKISVPIELVDTAKDAVQLQYDLKKLKDYVKRI
jgi:sporulation protein YlmC with PRC-barrel domain